MIKKIFSSVVMVALVIMTSGILNPTTTMAASITTLTDTMTHLDISTASDHEIKFVTQAGMAVSTNMTLVFSAGFTGIGSMAVGDFDVAEGSTTSCATSTFTERSMGASTNQFTASGSSQTVTITAGSSATPITAGRCMRIRMGLNATDTTGSTGPGTHQITNPSSVSTGTITIGGTFGDSGIISIPLMDSDAVNITASVNGSVTFDLNVGYTNASVGQPYSVPLGVLSSGSVKVSNNSNVNSIWANATSNSAGGMNVSVRNVNGTDGLVSASKNTDKIQAGGGTLSAGTALYGICVNTTGLVGWTKSATYTTTCAANSATNTVPALSSTATDILTSTAPLATGTAEIIVNATISTVTPAHTDYADTLTFIATGSF